MNEIEKAIQHINVLLHCCEDENNISCLRTAISALEKQVAKSPTHLYKSSSNGAIYGECPNCGHSGLKQHTHTCCWWCGQTLKREDNTNE